MKINRLYLKNYRSYSEAVFDFSDRVNVITGANGLGKTNLLEAIYILSGARSWRSGKNIELVKWETDGAFVFANATSRGRDFEIKLSIPARGRGSVTINDVRVQKKAKYLYNIQHIDESVQTRENREVCAYAFAVSEQNASGEKIVTAPTCGASGVLPAVMYHYQKKNDYSAKETKKDLRQTLTVTVGVKFYTICFLYEDFLP